MPYKDPEKKRQLNRRSYWKNHDLSLKRGREYHRLFKEKHNQACREYYWRNVEETRRKGREQYWKTRERRREVQRLSRLRSLQKVNCSDCNTEKLVRPNHILELQRANRKYRCTKCCIKDLHKSGELSHCWKGGRSITVDGYITVMAPNHPNADKRNRIKEHRKIMSEILGRPLMPYEVVHHRDGNRQNNAPENLELLLNRTHFAGQRILDLHLHQHQHHAHCPTCTCNLTTGMKTEKSK